MAVTSQTMQVATCDAPSCKVTRTAHEGTQIEGYHVVVMVPDGSGGGIEVTAFAHSEAHIGPAARAVLAAQPGTDAEPQGGLEGPIVPDGALDPDDEDEDGEPLDAHVADEVSPNGVAAR